MTANYSWLSIPAFYIINLLPHAYANALLSKRYDNASPRSVNAVEKYKKALTPTDFARWERAENAHRNGSENIPILLAAVAIGNFARLDVDTLNAVTGLYLISRIVYPVVYIQVTRRSSSLARSVLWAFGVGLNLYLMIKGGMKLMHAP